MNRHVRFFGCGLLALLAALEVQAACPAGTLWEPYTEVCAGVRDVRSEFSTFVEPASAVHTNAPVPGSMSAGTAYAPGRLPALEGGRLHTRMFVYPDGLERAAPLPAWLYTTATSRVDDGLEVLAMYTEDQEKGYLGLFAWPCMPEFPCPDGARAPSWQWSRPLPELACNITHVVDQGGHAHKSLYYANHSDRMNDDSPPLWKSAVYFWNYCEEAWDLAWEHVYRQDKEDCSAPDSICAWWGPSIEIFGDTVYPQVGELGYEDSLLYHDGEWSRLLPPDAEFRDPANPAWGSLTPWQLFHLEPNRSYGVGNWVNENDPPVIEGQAPLRSEAGEPLALDAGVLEISDADVDPAYHVAYQLTVYGGEHYTYSDGELVPVAGFEGTLVVPVSVSDGAAESATFDLYVAVGETDSAPVIQGQVPLQTPEEQSIEIRLDDLVIEYAGNDPSSLAAVVHDGASYTAAGTLVTPEADFFGNLTVPVTVTDGATESNLFPLTITVTPVNDPPAITGQRPVETLERTPVEIDTGSVLLSDPDTDASDLSMRVLDGAGYQRAANTVTPAPGIVGLLLVNVVATDGELDSEVFELAVQVIPDTVPPEIMLSGSPTVSVPPGSVYTDAGATAVDNVDGDISDRIVVANPVDTARSGTYTVTYRVEDFAGNPAAAARTVIVEATAPPDTPAPTSETGGGGGGAVTCLLLALGAAALGRRHAEPHRLGARTVGLEVSHDASIPS